MDIDDIWNTAIIRLDDGGALEVGDVAIAIGSLVFGLGLAYLFSGWIGRRLGRERLSAGAALILQRALFYLLSIAVLVSALQVLGIPLTVFAFLGGAVAIGVGFGTQNIVNNFISGWIMLAERQMRIGDLIEVDGNFGRVRAIGARSTRIQRVDGIDIIVPNSAMLERTVVNMTLSGADIRTKIRVGVAYGSPLRQVEEILLAVAADHPLVLDEPAPIVVFEEFGDSALVFDTHFWCSTNTRMELRRIRSDLRFEIESRFREAGIEIAFPQIEVHLDAVRSLPVHMAGDE